MGSGFAEGFGMAVEFGVGDQDFNARIPGSEGGELFDGVEGALGEFIDSRDRVDFEGVGEVFRSEFGVGMVEHGFDEGVVVGIVAGEAGGHVVTTEGGEVVGAGFEGGVDGESFDGACGAFANPIFALHEDGGAREAIDEAGADDPDDSGVPVFVCEDDRSSVWVGHPGLLGHLDGLFDDALLGSAAFVVEICKLLGKVGGALSSRVGHEFERVPGVSETTDRVESWGESESHGFGVDLIGVET